MPIHCLAMSHSHNSDGSDTDSDVQAINNSNRMATNMRLQRPDSSGTPRSLFDNAKGTFDPLKPLLVYATKQPKRASNVGGGSRDWKCNICDHS